jgi:hypothetical protein
MPHQESQDWNWTRQLLVCADDANLLTYFMVQDIL